VASVEPNLADDLDAAAWPARSVMAWDSDNAKAWFRLWHGEDVPLPPDEHFRYRGEHELYLQGLTLLGQVEPAVHGLGPWPARDNTATAAQLEPTPYQPQATARKLFSYPAAVAASAATAGLPLLSATLSPKEDSMPNPTTTGGSPPPSAPSKEPPQTDAAQADVATLQAENAELKKQLEAKASAQQTAEQQRIELMAQENAELKARLDAFDKRDRERSVAAAAGDAAAQLKAGGILTPANEAQLRPVLLAAAAADAELDEPKHLPATIGALQASASAVPLERRKVPAGKGGVQLTAEQAKVASMLGLSAEEYLEMESEGGDS
jgi:hypothetical protein